MLQHTDPALARLIPLLLPGGGHPRLCPARPGRAPLRGLAGGREQGRDGDGNAAAQPSAL